MIPLSPRIRAFPCQHGKAVFSQELRRLFWTESFDCVCLAFPEALEEGWREGVRKLPLVHAQCLEVDGAFAAFLPFDPADAYVEAMRQADQRRLPLHLAEDLTLARHPGRYALPDAYLLKSRGIGGYYDLAKRALPGRPSEALRHRADLNYRALRRLEARHGRILFLCDFPLLVQLEAHFREGSVEGLLAEGRDAGGDGAAVTSELLPVKPRLLYFALGELPFYTGELERERLDPLAPPADYLDLVKKVFLNVRAHYLAKEGEADPVSIKKLQLALDYLRNLAAIQGRLTPDLVDIATAAKGVFGSGFAAKTLESVRYYPFFEPWGDEVLEVGIAHAQRPRDPEPVEAVNLLADEPKAWKTIKLRKDPDPQQQRRYRYAWDPRGMCSHTPEDVRIEGFNRTARRRAEDMANQALARSEKLTSSLKDGVDVRETLRNWHTGGIWVKEVPPARGKVDTVVIIFDDAHDGLYPNRVTWYAEHEEESTLAFYATDPLAKLIGPGIAEARYGGLSLLFPPRPVPDIFRLVPAERFGSLCEQLTFGALLHSREKSVAFVSARRPGLRLREMARRLKKRLVWVPLHAFSGETLRRLRTFHILNGRHVRSWASRFIEE